MCLTAELRHAGHTHRQIHEAVAFGELERLRRGWVAARGADPELVLAAKRGALLTCATQAGRLGLWVMQGGPPHVAAPHRGSHLDWKGCVRHWERPLIPRKPGVLEDPVENVLQIAAGRLPDEQALAIIDSALNKKLATIAGLEQLPISRRLRRLLARATPFSDSGLETLFRERLGWLRVAIRVQAHVVGRRVDLLIGQRLIVQIDGSTHTGPQRDRDNAHDVSANMDGYTVLRFGYLQVMRHWEEAESVILGAIARGRHLADPTSAGRR